MKLWILACGLAASSLGVYLYVEVQDTNLRSPPAPRTTRSNPPPERPRSHTGSEPALPGGGPRSPVQIKASDERATPDGPRTGTEMREQIEAAFAIEAPAAPSEDRATVIEQRVRAVIPAGSFVRSVTCRSALCRIETIHPSLEDFQEFAQRAYLTPDTSRVSNGPVFAGPLAQPVEGQPVVAVAFLGRDGSILPTFTPVASTDGS